MIPIKINGVDNFIPTNWQEIRWCDYAIYLGCETLDGKAYAITGLSIDELPISLSAQILQLLSFLDTPEVLQSISKSYDGTHVGKESFGKLERAKDLIRKANNPFEAGAAIVKLYTGEDISTLSVTEAYNKIAFFLQVSQVS